MKRLGGIAILLIGPVVVQAEPKTGFQNEVRVKAPTRLDWEFAASSFDPKPELPARYDSRTQRYQLFVPENYDPEKTWPLVLFISPGDDPLGWRFWQGPCEESGMLFAAAYGAGNNVPVAERTRIVLDMFDDIRRHYRVDPDQTYLAGFSGGGRMACGIAFALPEYFGGVIPVCGTRPLNQLAYLRHRARDRLAVAFITGQADFNRKENEDFMAPLFKELGVRSRLWVVPKMAHAVPGGRVLAAVHAWLAEDLKRRREDAKTYPALVADPQAVRTAMQQADGLVQTATAELKHADRTWRAAALLEGVGQRWPDVPAASRAKKLLAEIQADPQKAKVLVGQKAVEEQRGWSAQAQAWERFGQRRRAVEAWKHLAKAYPGSQAGKAAAEHAKRLEAAIAAAPKGAYLGAGFSNDSTAVSQVAAGGPAQGAGLRVGDVVLKVGETRVAKLTDLVQALQKHKPGDEIVLVVRRGEGEVAVKVTLGARAAPGDE